MTDESTLLNRVRTTLALEPRSFETVATAFDLIERSASPLGGIAKAGVVLPGQLERFKNSLSWRPELQGRRMTVSEAYAFAERLARALELAAARQGIVKRGSPISSR